MAKMLTIWKRVQKTVNTKLKISNKLRMFHFPSQINTFVVIIVILFKIRAQCNKIEDILIGVYIFYYLASHNENKTIYPDGNFGNLYWLEYINSCHSIRDKKQKKHMYTKINSVGVQNVHNYNKKTTRQNSFAHYLNLEGGKVRILWNEFNCWWSENFRTSYLLYTRRKLDVSE